MAPIPSGWPGQGTMLSRFEKEAIVVEQLDFDRIDFHVHTIESPSPGAIPLDELIREAQERGLLCIALTDHWKEDTDPAVFSEERRLIEGSSSNLKIYLSAEVEILDEQASSPVDSKAHRDVLEKMDYLSAAPHLGEFLPEIRRRELPGDRAGFVEYVHRKMMNILRSDLLTLVLHPDYGVSDGARWGLCSSPSMENVPERWLDEFAEAAAFYSKAIEINENVVSSVEGYEVLVEKLLKAGTKLVVGSDYHPEYRDRYWPGRTRKAAEVIRRCGGDRRSLWLPGRRLP